MCHLVIVGGSSGIGRDIQAPMRDLGHVVRALPRSGVYSCPADALLFCQRYRGEHPWSGELETSLTRTKVIIEHRPASVRSIVVIASVAAVSVEEEQPVSYHACKAALVEMVKYYAVTLGPVRVNAILPGLTIKPEARAFYDAHPVLEATYKDITPSGRLPTVQDLAYLVDFLISDRSSYMTGQCITLDGGIGLRSNWATARRVHPDLRGLAVTQRTKA